MPSNINALKQCCKKKWAKIPSKQFENLINANKKPLLQIIAALFHMFLKYRVYLFFPTWLLRAVFFF